LTITGRKFFKPYASAACRRDKKILAKTVLAMLEKVNFEKTVLLKERDDTVDLSAVSS
jgi:hypothetical protein